MSIQGSEFLAKTNLVTDIVSQTGYELNDESFQLSQKRKYNQVDFDLRKELLDCIESQQLSIKAASEQLGINYSTAKNIVRIYRKEKRMHKLPKRVNKALEEVLKAWKKPGKKLSRFVAKKCSLFEDKHTETRIGEKDSVEPKKKAVEEARKSDDTITLIDKDKSEENKPLFDFFAYTPLILESWARKNTTQPRWTQGSLWCSPLYF